MKYRMKVNSELRPEVKAGTIVYGLMKHDYGCANHDTRNLGVEHISVTLREDGDYPSFTVPVRDLEVIA